MAHDYKAEIAAALKSDDAAALAGIAYILLGRVQEAEAQREKENERKRNWRKGRDATSSDVAGQDSSTETSNDVARRRIPSPDGSVGSPVHTVTTRSTTTHTHTAREIEAVDDEKLVRDLDLARVRYTEHWPDIDAFLKRRDYAKWQGWLDEMARLVGNSSQFTADDLSRVCRDDRLLKDPIATAYGLRQFLQRARQERIGQVERSPPSGAARTGSPSRRDTKVTTGPAVEPTEPGNIKWQT